MHRESCSRTVMSTCGGRGLGPPGSVVRVVVVVAAVLAALAGVASPALAGISDDSVTPTWVKTELGFGASSDHADAVALAAGGVAYVAGWAGNFTGNDDITLAKYVNGVTDPAWGGKKTWDSAFGSLDQAHGVATGPGGVVYTVGSTHGKGMRAVVIKWSAATGAVKWVRYYGSTALTCWGENIAVDRRGNVVIAGTCEADGKRDWYVVSWSPSGKRRWTWRPGAITPGGPQCYLEGLSVAGDGSVYLTGSQNDGGQVTTVRLSASGKRLWSRVYRGAGLWVTVHDLTRRPSGGVYLSGSMKIDDTRWAGLIVRYTAAGRRKVFARDVGSGDIHFTEVAVASGGSVVGAGFDTSSGGTEMHYALYASSGALRRTGNFGDVKRTWAGVATDSFGGFYLTACTVGGTSGPTTLGRFETQRASVVDGGGTWTGLYQPYATTEWKEPLDIAVRGSTVVVVGYVDTGGPSGEDQIAIGYTY